MHSCILLLPEFLGDLLDRYWSWVSSPQEFLCQVTYSAHAQTHTHTHTHTHNTHIHTHTHTAHAYKTHPHTHTHASDCLIQHNSRCCTDPLLLFVSPNLVPGMAGGHHQHCSVQMQSVLWSSLRCVLPDGLPLLGASLNVMCVYVACVGMLQGRKGHFKYDMWCTSR